MEPVERLTKVIEMPEEVSIKVENRILVVNGPKGEVSKKIATKQILFGVDNNVLRLTPNKKSTRSEKCLINTYHAHIQNMIKGVQEPFVYKLKICSSHFPMSVKIKGTELEVTNFIGERVARKLKLKSGVDIKMEGEIITITSPSKELAGQVAADIEKLTKRSGFDKRVFMDGIYIIEKAGVELK